MTHTANQSKNSVISKLQNIFILFNTSQFPGFILTPDLHCDVTSVLFVIFRDVISCFYIFLWPQEAERALLRPQGHFSIRTISKLSQALPKSHFLFPFLLFHPLSVYLISLNSYFVRHSRPCPYSVTTIHSPAGLLLCKHLLSVIVQLWHIL